MKKLIIAAAFILLAGVAFGQTIKKGSVLGIHHVTITLNPGATLEQYMDFQNTKIIPAAEKHFAGVKLFAMKGNRGEHENGYASMWFFESIKDRDVYFTAEGGLTEKGLAAQEKMMPLLEELSKLGTSTTTHTDWVVQ
jgi:hypothetical protein